MSRASQLTLVLVALAACLALVAAAPTPARANGTCSLGVDQHVDGTIADPIRIATKADLVVLATEAGCYSTLDVFLQTADIDLGGTPWVPIALGGLSFTGTYDGGGHRITGLLVDETSAPGAAKALFASTNGATIANLAIDGARIEGGVSGYGILVGHVGGGAISNIVIRDATIVEQDAGEQFYGGLAGDVYGATIHDVRVEGIDIISSDGVATGPSKAGGAIGLAVQSTISDVAVTRGSISGDERVGGVIGRLECSRLERVTAGSGVAVVAQSGLVGGVVGDAANVGCPDPPVVLDPVIADVASAATVRGQTRVGGLIGQAVHVTVSRAAASGPATATVGEAGGLIGSAAATAISDAYAVGAVTAAGAAGGLLGAVIADPADTTSITRAYAAGRVTAGARMPAGGLVSGATFDCPRSSGVSSCAIERRDAAVTASFWDAASTGQSASPGGGSARSTAQLRSRGTFAAAGWSIAAGRPRGSTATWGICTGPNAGRPFLQWQARAATGRCHDALVVLSTRTAGGAIVTRVRVGGAAVLVQRGTVVQGGATTRAARRACRTTTARPASAGVVTLRCTLTASARAALRDDDLRVRLVTRVVPADGLPATAVRTVVVPRLPPVTG